MKQWVAVAFAIAIGAAAEALEARDGWEMSLSAVLTELVEEDAAPAAAIIVVRTDKPPLIQVAGVKVADEDAPAVASDPWHIGSNMKAMTATLAMGLVEDGVISLDTTIPDVLGSEMKIHDGWSRATLRMLLSHRSGAAPNAGRLTALRYMLFGSEGVEGPSRDRRAVVTDTLRKPPETEPGAEYVYSNLGYTIAGAMLEAAARQPFESLIEERVFTPLAMEGVVLGAPSAEVGFRGHQGDPPSPAPAGADNPFFMSPAGTFSYPLEAYARFLEDQLRGHRGESALLSSGSYKALRTPVANNNNYALGWGLSEEGWLRHSGSNTMWMVTTVIAPDRNIGISILSNSGEVRGLGERITRLIEAYPSATGKGDSVGE
ncbi:MAG: serine hydrolase domain-containing protein [Halieaceae bacterium]|jgi:CubicO group peptidase (beta-lactamase class C family)|nr:serine hydrolase domain-containing protein [Halieaceae bacterium]